MVGFWKCQNVKKKGTWKKTVIGDDAFYSFRTLLLVTESCSEGKMSPFSVYINSHSLKRLSYSNLILPKQNIKPLELASMNIMLWHTVNIAISQSREFYITKDFIFPNLYLHSVFRVQ